ncbi:hypothetical protein FJY68_02830 [candidate division WOR-3 bacterium]|uniref:Uncharacterized protein n=1 Tax=candidate division WOR-3 bacterium TaxID=2052148 RepID=A0A937XFM0_UNCW3|nr:hypothetical protein [candidate division WOR-3 bacterium]
MVGVSAVVLLALLAPFVQTTPSVGVAPVPVGQAPAAAPVGGGPISTPVVQPVGPGQVDWSYQKIQATGMSVIDPAKPRAQALAMAIRGAKVDAQRNLLETVKGVRVVSETKVQDLMVKGDYVYTRIDGVIKGATVVGEPRETQDGRVEVTMEVPMYDAGGIAPPIADKLHGQPQPVTAKGTLSDDDLVRAQSLSGVVFDLSGVKTEPQMFPTLLDSTGGVLLDMAKQYKLLGPEAFKKFQYVKSMTDILNDKELLTNPTVIKVLEAAEKGWVVAREDVKKVSWLDRALDIIFKVGKTVSLFL